MRGLHWEISPPLETRHTLAKALNVPPLVGQMLLNRGLNNVERASRFLAPALGQLHDPLLIHDMEKAAARLANQVVNGPQDLPHRGIAIFGDYDVDGVTATTTLFHALRHFGVTPLLYLPHRQNEGYGINDEAIRKLVAQGAQLIISVDCGITAVGPAKVAAELGIDLIVTDHHEWKETLPVCYATVHPRLGTGYPNKELCGAGVAHKLAWALGKQLSGSEKVAPEYATLLRELLAFTALGSIADVVPLVDENRVIALSGLSALPTSPFIGVKALLKSAGLHEEVDGYHVGFTLAPRLNAAGRMGHAHDALELFTTDDPARAEELAKLLETQNKARQATERAIVVEAKAQAELYAADSAMVLLGPGWNSGVVGIVASRIIDEYYCPTVVLVESGEDAHGSARSIEGFNLAQGLKSCEHLFDRWGGHAMAAGVKLPTKNVAEFRRLLNKYVKQHCPEHLLKRSLLVDAVAGIEEFTVDLVTAIKRLGPFGTGNRRPLLAILDAVVREPKTIGKDGKHLTFKAYQGGAWRKCLAWNQGDMAHLMPTDMRVNLVVEPELNEWQGRSSVELLCRDVIPVAS